jgi:hypothetical protein
MGSGLQGLTRQQRVAEFDQLSKFLFLFRDPIRRPTFVSSTGVCGGLFDQITDILPRHGNALIKFSNRRASHCGSPGLKTLSQSMIAILPQRVAFWCRKVNGVVAA